MSDIIAPALVVDPRTGRQTRHPVRTSDGAVIGPTREDLVVRAINQRIAAASGTDIEQGEALAILRYGRGQEYRPHLDSIANADNQRRQTMLLYLNDDFTGGETCFTRSGLKIVPKTGDALLFDNVDGQGRPAVASEHAGLPVTRGVKWLATRWIRAARLDPWQSPA